MHNRYTIDHILKEKLECIGQLPDDWMLWRMQHNYLTLTTAQTIKLMQAQMRKLMMNKHKHTQK